jgi:integrase
VHCKYWTLVTYEAAMREHLVPSFGTRWLHEIGEREIAAFQANLTKKAPSPKTVRNIVTVLSSAGYLDRLPEIRMPKSAAARARFLNLEEYLRLEEASTSSWQLMIHFARKTGLKIGELCALESEQLNPRQQNGARGSSRGRKKVSSPKGNRSRSSIYRRTWCA